MKRAHFVLALLLVIPLLLDQGVKYILKKNLLAGLFLNFGKGAVGLTYHANEGFIGNIGAPYWLIMSVVGIFLLLLIVLFVREYVDRHAKVHAYTIGLALIIGGALSNFIDRLLFGFVIDFIQLGMSVINLADVAIFVGVLVVLCGRHMKTLDQKQKDVVR